MNTRSKWPILCSIALFLFAASVPSRATAAEVTFRFRAPEHAKLVTVAGTFNQWNSTAAPMSDVDGDGVWEITFRLEPGTHQYKFVVNGSDWYHDEFASGFVDDGFGGKNSLVQVAHEPMSVGEPLADGSQQAGTDVTFSFAPQGHANAVSVAGSFNDWNAAAHVMRDDDRDGVWEITVRLEPGEYAYQFVVDGDRWFTDPTAPHYAADGFGGRSALIEVGAQPLRLGPASKARAR